MVKMEQPTVNLWVKMEPFIVGVLQIPPPSKFSMHYLRKMSTYVRMRSSEGYYPYLSWPMWRHIACGKLQLEKDLAWLYFELFDSLVECTSEKRLEWAEVISSCATEEEAEEQRNKAGNCPITTFTTMESGASSCVRGFPALHDKTIAATMKAVCGSTHCLPRALKNPP